MNGTKSQQNVNLAILNEKVGQLESAVKHIAENELTHIKDKLETIDKKNAYFSGGIAVLIILLEVIFRLWK